MLIRHDLDLIKSDTSLPQLRDVLDKACYEGRLLAAAPEADASGAMLTYLRYKPGVNCLAGYEYQAAGKPRYAYTKIFSDEQQDKRDKFILQSGSSRNEALGFSFFPNDGKLRSLRKMDGAEREKQFVERVFSDRRDLWTGEIHAIRYKPERRFVARLVVDGRDVSVVKMHTANSYARLRNSNKSFKSRENLKLAKRIGHSDRHRVLAFEWLPGLLLSDLLRAGKQVAKILVPVGEALAQIHAQRADRLPANSAEMQAEHIDSVAQQVSFLYPALSLQLKQTARRLNHLMVEGAGVYKATHGDFYAKQILLDGDHVGVLDFDESAFDDPMSDLGNFFAHLERDRLRFNLSEDLIKEYQEALLAGYSAAGQSINSRRVDLFYAANLFKLLPHPFRFREENWPVQTTLLLDKVQRVLVKAEATKLHFSSLGREPSEGLPKNLKFNRDEALPFLKDALDPVSALPTISKSLRTRYPEASIDTINRASLRRHKAGRRCLIEYAIPLHRTSGEDELIHVLGKARRRKIDRATFDLTRTLWEGTFNTDSEGGMYVPEPLGLVPEFNMWLQRKIEGYTATHYLNGIVAAPLASNMAHVLHKLNTEGPAVERTHTLQDELEILTKRLTQLSTSFPIWKPRMLDVLAACQSLAQGIPEVKPQPIHRDFYPDNLLVADNGIYLLDLDLYCMGDPALDAGNFIAHVMEYGLRKEGDSDAYADCYQAFEEAFVKVSGEQVRLPVHMYTTLALARHIQISTLFEDRRRFTEEILCLCERRLANYSMSSVKSPVTKSLLSNATNLVD